MGEIEHFRVIENTALYNTVPNMTQIMFRVTEVCGADYSF